MALQMTLQLGSSIISGYLTNEIPGLISGSLNVAGLRDPLEVRLKGNFLRDIAGCRLDFTNPIPQSNPYFVSMLSDLQSGESGEMTASRRIIRALKATRPPKTYVAQAPKTALKNLLFLEWFNAQGQRIVIQSWHWQLKASVPIWQLPKDLEQDIIKQNRERRKKFLLESRRDPSDADYIEPVAPTDALTYEEPINIPVLPQPTQGHDLRCLNDAQVPFPEQMEIQIEALKLAIDLERLEEQLSRPVGVLARPTLASLLQSIADLCAQLSQTMRHFATLQREGWSYLVTDVEQSLLLMTAAVNVCEDALKDQELKIDREWLTKARMQLECVEKQTAELLEMMRR